MKKLIFLGSLIFFLLLLSTPAVVHAQTSSGYDVTVSPIFFDLSTTPGTSVGSVIKIRNNTNSPLPIKLGVQRLTGDLNGNLTLKADKNDYTLAWVTFKQDAFVAKPLVWTEIPFTINVPKEAAYGYYWTITFTQDKTSPLSKSGVSLTGAAAVPLLLNVVKPGAKMQGKLVNFSADSGIYEYPPIKFLINFSNTGNVHIRPHGSIFVKDWLGRQLAVLDVNPGQGAILPNAARIFNAVWDDSFITVEPKTTYGQPKLDKNGKPETQLNIRWDKILDLRIGRYTATTLLVVSTPQRDVPYEAATSFWIFPWKVVLGTLLVVAFAGLGFYNTLKGFARRVAKLFGFGTTETKE